MSTKILIPNPSKKIDDLRLSGFKVFVSHKRPLKGSTVNIFFSRQEMIDNNLDLNEHWDVKGGKTTVHIYTNDHTLVGYGEAVCSRHDVFNKNLGLTIALGRALSDANL